ncbi:MAG: hypothetical protein ABIJ41_01940 [Candidatus Omnitrophota bacterium]
MNKQEELNITSKFLIHKYSHCKEWEIMNKNEVKKVFPSYNGENPDCVISDGRQHVGVECFKLCLTVSPQLESKRDEDGHKIINLLHRQSKFPKKINMLQVDTEKHIKALKRYGLALQDKIDDILKQELPDKFAKSDGYVTPGVWLLGYANEFPSQMNLIHNVIEDNAVDALRQMIAGMNVPLRIKKIFLFEVDINQVNHLLEIFTR